jgi:small conductance mechanosensitive channel
VPGDGDYVYDLLRELGLSDLGARTVQVFVQRPAQILLILGAALLVSRLGVRVVRRSVQSVVARSGMGDDGGRGGTRAQTLGGVAASLVRVFVWTVAALMVLDTFGVNLGPLLAGASIVGVAVGFGAQSLVRDFLSGFFILAEDQFGVGDSVTIGDTTGTVEEINLRITRLRGADGTVWFVPNGEIRKVGNAAKGWSRAIVDVTVPVRADVAAATRAIADELAALAADPAWADAVLEPPEVLGVEDMGPERVTVRVAAKTRPAQRAQVAREVRARMVARLRRDGLAEGAEGAEGAGGAGGVPLPPAVPPGDDEVGV